MSARVAMALTGLLSLVALIGTYYAIFGGSKPTTADAPSPEPLRATVEIPAQPCPSCQKNLNALGSPLRSTTPPVPGKYAVCVYCTEILKWSETLTLEVCGDAPPHVREIQDRLRALHAKKGGAS